ncbi:protein FAM135B-like isoform X1 [Senna tora]|uniref:Protein FAM135B-like isoform X1 n=1 Tax=Senna tora TaxID=362788 RepID=A0A834SFV2_9FABA|nr:protein FAM135B-like isoform X1 [Senna tora]
MFRKLGWALNQRSWSMKRLHNVEQPGPATAMANNHLPMLDAVHEVAIYVHRFHNLDLFDQGWYRIKITMRWENDESSYPGIPARVAQYEAPHVDSDKLCRVWRIDDIDNSFSTPPFRIKYARQDVFLCIMVSFYLSFGGYEGKSASAVILRFELMHSPLSNVRPELQSSLDHCSTAVHEYRIPPKALLGLHSYCPVHFDSLHTVLVDASVHISLLRAGYRTPRLKVPSDNLASEGTHGEDSVLSNKIRLIKALIAAHNILLEDLRILSKGIDQAIDLTGISSKLESTDGEASQLDNPQGSAENAADYFKLQTEGDFQTLSSDDLLSLFRSLGNQLLYLWNKFLMFHREHKMKIMEFLHNSWANDRKAEWSIWMVYSKVENLEMPHHCLSNRVEGTSPQNSLYGRGRSLSLRRSRDEPIQTALTRAELHRRGIAHMRINNRSLQDMFIFGDPLHVPIIIVERMANIQRSISVNSYFIPLEGKAEHTLKNGPSAMNKPPASSPQKNEHALRVGHHLDLRLIRNQWLLIDPKVHFLMSESNEDRTSEDFREMGSRLAKEVISFLNKKISKASMSGNLKNIKLSFVGHSIGNLIIRTALAEKIMEPYLRYLYTFVSMSGPHLGYLYSSNSIFNSGLWLLKKLKGTQCIHQLTFTDDPDLENTFIYNLSKKKTLANFRNVVLLSSPQDGYVPYHSARIEPCSAASSDPSKRGKIFLEMLNNCLDQIRALSDHRVVMRCDINFDTSSYGKNLNTLIGRAAHIEFLESDIFAKFIMWSFPEMFR